uniref:Ubiquitin-like protease family profile domain-containing protein n=1 Tax=Photinus pyralis TaxID=7054 RepID=A0A1Y1LYY3_PHOPY
MNTLELQRALNLIQKKAARAVFASDELIRASVRRPFAAIVNTDVSTRTGQHWNGIYIDEDGNGEYFDSFGRPPTGLHLKFLKKHARKFTFNSRVLQHPLSTYCGQYCLMYLVFKFNNLSLKEFVDMFNNDLECNDDIIDLLYNMTFYKVNLID